MFVDSHNHLLDYLEKLYKKDNFTKEELLLAYDNLEVIFCTSSNEEIRFTKQEAICNLLNVDGFDIYVKNNITASNDTLLIKYKKVLFTEKLIVEGIVF